MTAGESTTALAATGFRLQKGCTLPETQACMMQVASLQARLENGDIYIADLKRSLAESGKSFHSILVCTALFLEQKHM